LISSDIHDELFICKIRDKISFFIDDSVLLDNSSHAFLKYFELLKAWNEKINLVSDSSFDVFIDRHICDSLMISKAFDLSKTSKMLDIGSGAGFPGIPLKIIFDQIELVSVDSTRKKADFQREVAGFLALKQVDILNERIENLKLYGFEAYFDVVVARALSQIPTLLEISLPFLNIGGHIILIKGKDADKELLLSQKALNSLGGSINNIYPYDSYSGNSITNSIIIVEKTAPTPDKYPRRNGIPFKRPII